MKKIALVGCGRISKRHIEAITSTEGVEIAYVCDKNEEKAKAAMLLFAERFNAKMHSDADAKG